MLFALLLACTPPTPAPEDPPPRPAGDAARGWDVLRYGDFVGAGVPVDLWFEYVGEARGNVLDRDGDAARLPPGYNLFTSPEGVDVVGGIACLGCHGGYVDGDFVPGLGNTFVDYTESAAPFFEIVLALANTRYGGDSPEYAATERLVRGAKAAAPYIVTPFAGVNPAFSIERSVVAWRDPETLRWLPSPQYEVPDTVPASDTPPWWNVKKKTVLYYNGMGRGDQARLIEQTGVVGIIDAAHAADIDQDFADVLAWIEQLEPPPFPRDVDADAAAAGRAVFEANCSLCHGTYGDVDTYPGVRVPVDEVGTDPVYAEELAYAPFNDWLEASWYGQDPWGADFDAALGYVAPPLDGVWATAPYLHNGSVPDLAALLESSTRPARWTRSFTSSAWDFERVGLPWTPAEGGGAQVYDTTLRGFGNGGHTYGDALTAEDRAALLVYLTTL